MRATQRPAPADSKDGTGSPLQIESAARLPAAGVLGRLDTARTGLTSDEALERLRRHGPNALRTHRAQALSVLLRQLRSPLLVLLIGAAILSAAVGQHADAGIIMAIIALSVGLGFANEYRAARAVEALHSTIRHTAVALRDGRTADVDVTHLVPGDVVHLSIGDVVPADLRLLDVNGLECDEAVLTGEAAPVTKETEPIDSAAGPLALPNCAFMGTLVRAGTAWGVVVATGQASEFGHIAARLGEHQPVTAFEAGLRDFSTLLVQITAILTVSIFVINAALQRPLLESALFALAIAVGLTPQLLPAIVTISLSTGAHRLARRSVVVKRLISIEDLGNIDVLFTDKTGTLTEGRISFVDALDTAGASSPDVLRLGVLCTTEAPGAPGVASNALDRVLLDAGTARAVDLSGYQRIAEAPFDYDRRVVSVLVREPGGAMRMITKGAPESVLARCGPVTPEVRALLEREFRAGRRLIAVAVRDAAGMAALRAEDEHDLAFAGVIVFEDPPKADARESIERLARLGIEVKVVTGDNEMVAQHVCAQLAIGVKGTITGAGLEAMSEEGLVAALPGTTIFARVTPEQKSRIIRAERSLHRDVAFLGDGVNDAVALHDADVGISVDSATDVAKDAADIVLLAKDLGILADGVVEGRRIFSNTIKYVLMGTSSNFGNMFSAAGASLVLSFLPMLPSQILLNNFLYDLSEMTIPTDRVDEELLERPSRWDIAFIRRFMLMFGPISSLYDFLTFGVMIWVFDAGEKLFHSGWFVESLATQTLVIFIIRTRRVPFFRSRASWPLAATSIVCVAVGAALPYTPIGDLIGFTPLPLSFLLLLAGMVATYLTLVELAKARFFRPVAGGARLARTPSRHRRRVVRLLPRWVHAPTRR